MQKQKINNKAFRIILISLGWIFVALGVIGAFLPVMPTTIFLLIAAGLFARSSDRFYNWLINHKYLGVYIRDYMKHRGMPLKAKIIAISMLLLTIGYSAFFVVEQLTIQILLIVIALGVSIYIISIKTINKPIPTTD